MLRIVAELVTLSYRAPRGGAEPPAGDSAVWAELCRAEHDHDSEGSRALTREKVLAAAVAAFLTNERTPLEAETVRGLRTALAPILAEMGHDVMPAEAPPDDDPVWGGALAVPGHAGSFQRQ